MRGVSAPSAYRTSKLLHRFALTDTIGQGCDGRVDALFEPLRADAPWVADAATGATPASNPGARRRSEPG